MERLKLAPSIIKKAVEKTGMTTKDVAIRAGVSYQYLSRVMSGAESLSPRTAVKISYVLDLDCEAMLVEQSRERIKIAIAKERAIIAGGSE